MAPKRKEEKRGRKEKEGQKGAGPVQPGMLGEIHTYISKLKAVAPQYFPPEVVEGIIRCALQGGSIFPATGLIQEELSQSLSSYKHPYIQQQQSPVHPAQVDPLPSLSPPVEPQRKRGRPSAQSLPFALALSPH